MPALLARVQWLHLAWRSRFLHIPMKRKLPGALQRADGGSQWWALSGACAVWLLQHVDANPALSAFFRYSFIPDERFIQTLVMHSPFRDRVVSEHCRHVASTRGHPTPPATLTAADHASIQADRRSLFARKSAVGVDAAILDLLDADRSVASGPSPGAERL